MIFVRAQALDHVSPDQCVLDGALLDAAAPEAAEGIALLSETVRCGKVDTDAGIDFADGTDDVAVKVPTGELDEAGRQAPVMAAFSRGLLDDVADTAQSITQYAHLLGRTVDGEAFAAALTTWGAGKGPGRLVARVGRRTWRALLRMPRALLRTLLEVSRVLCGGGTSARPTMKPLDRNSRTET